MITPPIDWPLALRETGQLLLAYLLALPVGWHRETEAHSIGIRTFPLVSVASCGYLLLGMPEGARDVTSESRVIQGVVAGIGFIGGGAILKSEGNVRGTATAASICVLLPLKKRIDSQEGGGQS